MAVISVSIDLGAGRRGVDMGPSAIRVAGLSQMLRELSYDVREVGTVTASGPETTEAGEACTRFVREITEVCRRTRALVAKSLSEGAMPLVLGGDHSLSKTVSGVAGHVANSDESVGVRWLGAHTDMNTLGTTPSGNVHGMALAILTGQGGARAASDDGGLHSGRAQPRRADCREAEVEDHRLDRLLLRRAVLVVGASQVCRDLLRKVALDLMPLEHPDQLASAEQRNRG